MKRIINLLCISLMLLFTPILTSAYSTNNKLMIIVEDNVSLDEDFFSRNSTYHEIISYSKTVNYNIKNYSAYAVNVNLLKSDYNLKRFVRNLYESNALVYLYGESISGEDVKDVLDVEEFVTAISVYDADEDTSFKSYVSIELNSSVNIISLCKGRENNLIASVGVDSTKFSLNNQLIKIIINDYIDYYQTLSTYSTLSLGSDLVQEVYKIKVYYEESYYNIDYKLYKSHYPSSTNDYFGLLTTVSPYTPESHMKANQFYIVNDFIQTNSNIMEAQPASIDNATLVTSQVSLNGPTIGSTYAVSGKPNIETEYDTENNRVTWVVRKSQLGDYLNGSYFTFGSSHASPRLLAEAKIKISFKGMFRTLWGLGASVVTPVVDFTIKYRYCDLSYDNPISHDISTQPYNFSYHKHQCSHCPYYYLESHTWVHTSYQSYCMFCGYVAPILAKFEDKE